MRPLDRSLAVMAALALSLLSGPSARAQEQMTPMPQGMQRHWCDTTRGDYRLYRRHDFFFCARSRYAPGQAVPVAVVGPRRDEIVNTLGHAFAVQWPAFDVHAATTGAPVLIVVASRQPVSPTAVTGALAADGRPLDRGMGDLIGQAAGGEPVLRSSGIRLFSARQADGGHYDLVIDDDDTLPDQSAVKVAQIALDIGPLLSGPPRVLVGTDHDGVSVSNTDPRTFAPALPDQPGTAP